jgi:hypothetical protein
MAGEKGIVINISGSGEGAAEALRQIEARMKETQERALAMQSQISSATERFNGELEGTVSAGRAAGGAMHEIEGKLPTRAFEAFIVDTLRLGPIIQAAFPLIGLIAFIDVAKEGIEKIHSMSEAAEHAAEEIRRSWDKVNTSLAHSSNEVDAQIDKTIEETDKLLGHRGQNILREQFDDARVAADKLGESILKDLEDYEKLIERKENKIGFWNSLFTGKAETKKSEDLLQTVHDNLQKTSDEYDALVSRSGETGNGHYLQEAQEARIIHLQSVYDDATKRINAALSESENAQKTFEGSGKTVGKDQTANINLLAAALRNLAEQQRNIGTRYAEDSAKSKNAVVTRAHSNEDEDSKLRLGREKLTSQAAALARELQQTLQREADAELQLAQAKENAELAIIKAGNQAQLQLLESQHAAGIVGFEEYYARRLELTQSAIDKEIDVERTKRDQIQQQIGQINDPNGAEKQRIAALQRQVVEEQAQIARLGKGGGSQEQQRSIELQQKLIADQAKAAEEEVQNKIRVDGLQKELVASQAKITELAVQRGTAEVQTTAELNQQRWAQQVAAAEQTIRDREKQEAWTQRIQSLKTQGAEAGPEAMNVEAARAASQTISSFMNQMAEGAMRGKMSFRDMADSVILDLSRMAMKMAEERAILPFMSSLFGISGAGSGSNALAGILQQGASNAASMSTSIDLSDISIPYLAGGGDIDNGWAVVGDGGDGSGSELFAPKGPGTVLPHDVLEGLAANRGGGGTPNVTINTINNSSSPVQQSTAGVNYDSQAKQFIIHTVLEDMNQGGPVSAAMSGFARS